MSAIEIFRYLVDNWLYAILALFLIQAVFYVFKDFCVWLIIAASNLVFAAIIIAKICQIVTNYGLI